MSRTQLIGLTDIKLFKGISSNLNQPKDLIPNILEAQDFNLRPFMGESFYLELLDEFESSPSLNPQIWKDLFSGVRYTWEGKQYEHEGLRAVLIYHAYASYQSTAGSTDTPFGRRHKSSDHSERVSDKTTSRLIAQARAGAMSHQERVALFLNRYSENYPLWECSGGKKYRAGLVIKQIG
jgi:hypothetical protein